jgi:hypothetical protein
MRRPVAFFCILLLAAATICAQAMLESRLGHTG